MIASIDPTTGATVREYAEMSGDQVASIIADCHAAYDQWKGTSFDERSRLMMKAANILRERASEYAEIMALEMGKITREGKAEAEKCAWVCEYYAENAERFLEKEVVETDAGRSYISYQPLGVVLAVMPWNFPFWQVFRFAAPALMAGNVGVLKHASNVPASALAIQEVFNEAGFPENTFRTLLVGSQTVASVIDNPLVQAVTLTGSAPAGSAVAGQAGNRLKKTVLELGGSDPAVILEDADIENAVEACVIGRMINAGQSCIAAKRFVVVEAVREEFEEKFTAAMSKLVMGDPQDERTDVGPLARHDLRDELHGQVTDSIDKGAKLLLGGEVPDLPGAYYPPTVLTNVGRGMPAYDHETFGPVAAIIPVRKEEDAIRVANDTVFGLGASVYTSDIEKGERIAEERLEAGACFVNTFVRSDPRLPFGGVKESGYGRELSRFGIHEFVNVKTVYVK